MVKFPSGPDISHSKFGQWIHDSFPKKFYFIDVDGIIYKRKTKILRILEWKKPFQKLKPSQKYILPLLAQGIEYLIRMKFISEQSGVFIIFTDSPFEEAEIVQIAGKYRGRLTGEQWKSFVSGKSLDLEKRS